MIDLFPHLHARLDGALAHDARAISIVGPPGAGKSTWIRRARPRALHVDLAHAPTPEAVITHVWAALAHHEDPGALEDTLRGLPSALLVLDHADDALAHDASGLLSHWLSLAPNLRIVLVTRLPSPPWDQHLITLDAPEPGARDALIASWLPDAPMRARDQLVAHTSGNPGALFVLSRRARLIPLSDLLADPAHDLLGALGRDLDATASSLAAGALDMRDALSVFLGPFSLGDARAVCGESFDFDLLQLLSDSGWLSRPSPHTWHLSPLLRSARAPSDALRAAHARSLDAWAKGWRAGSREPARDAIALSARLDDLVAAWRWLSTSRSTHPHPDLYAALAWLSSAPASSTWRRPPAHAAPPRPVADVESDVRRLARSGHLDEAVNLTRQALSHPERRDDVERAGLWARLGKLHRAGRDHRAAALAYDEAAQGTLGAQDWSRTARYLWRSAESWSEVSDDERARDSVTELLALLAERPDLAATRPPGLEALARTLGVLVELEPTARDAPPERGDLHVDDARSVYLRADGARVDMSRKRVAARLFGALLSQHDAHPGHPLSFRELFELGWPGQHHIAEASALNRLRVAIARLRSGGLDPFIVTHDDGYMIAPETRITSLD